MGDQIIRRMDEFPGNPENLYGQLLILKILKYLKIQKKYLFIFNVTHAETKQIKKLEFKTPGLDRCIYVYQCQSFRS